MTKTGVFATEEEVESLKKSMQTPLIMLQCGMPKSPQKRCHELALVHGLPEITGMYGLDLKSREFVTV